MQTMFEIRVFFYCRHSMFAVSQEMMEATTSRMEEDSQVIKIFIFAVSYISFSIE